MSDVSYPPIDISTLMPRADAETTIAGFETRISALEVNGVKFVGVVNVAETATIAISAGVRKVPVDAPGVVVGGNYALFPVSQTPAGYALADVIATAVNKLMVTVTAPLLALGASYSIPCRLVKVGA